MKYETAEEDGDRVPEQPVRTQTAKAVPKNTSFIRYKFNSIAV
ncbi:MAG: hypothetical protein V7K57_25050 [Nostoc sp.]